MRSELSDGEIELLIDGLSDDVALVWVLIHLGLRENPSTSPSSPSTTDVDAAFEILGRLSQAGLVKIGRMEYSDGGPPGRLAPVRHVAEPLDDVKQRVITACAARDWEWSCWSVNTAAGDDVARRALGGRSSVP